MADLKKASDISIFKFFTGTLDEFKTYFNKQTPEEQTRLNEMIIWIHEYDVNKKVGYIRANGKYYTSDFSEFEEEIKQFIDNRFSELEPVITEKISAGVADAKRYTDDKFSKVDNLIDEKIKETKIELQTDYINRDASLKVELNKTIVSVESECKTYTDEKFAELQPIEISYIEGL